MIKKIIILQNPGNIAAVLILKKTHLKVESIEARGRRPEVNELNCKSSGREQLGLAARLPPFSLTFFF
jgi:hypothetical protein